MTFSFETDVFYDKTDKSSVIANWRKSDLWIEQSWGKTCRAPTDLFATSWLCDTREMIRVAIPVSSLLIFGFHTNLYMQWKVCRGSQGDSSHLHQHESAGSLMQALVFLAPFRVFLLYLLYSLGLSPQN